MPFDVLKKINNFIKFDLYHESIAYNQFTLCLNLKKLIKYEAHTH
jgi:hypothetical protein